MSTTSVATTTPAAGGAAQRREKLRRYLTRVLADAPVSHTVGFGIERWLDDGVVMTQRAYPRSLLTGFAMPHGGVLALIVDTVGWFAAAGTRTDHASVAQLVTASLNVHYVGRAHADARVVAVGHAVKNGRTQSVVDVRVFVQGSDARDTPPAPDNATSADAVCAALRESGAQLAMLASVAIAVGPPPPPPSTTTTTTATTATTSGSDKAKL